MRRETIEKLAAEVSATLEYKGTHVYIHREGKRVLHALGFTQAYSKLHGIKKRMK